MTIVCHVFPGDTVYYVDPTDRDPSLVRSGRCVGYGRYPSQSHTPEPIIHLMGGTWVFISEIVRVERGPGVLRQPAGSATIDSSCSAN
jgi:hypothetical protein